MRPLPGLCVVLVGAGALVAGAALYLAKLLRIGALDVAPDRESDPLEHEVVDLQNGLITLRAAVRRPRIPPGEPGIWGLESTRGYDQVGEVVGWRDGYVVRHFVPVQNVTRPGDRVRLDSFVHAQDPRLAHGLHFDEVRVRAPLGEFPAWLLPGDNETWAILTHGKGATRREALRMIPMLHAAGLTSLAVTYRNDENCPPDPAGFYAYGRTEWEELEAAARYALNHGARRLLLVGYSMGGAITMSFMARSSLAGHVAALILDSPMLHFEKTVIHGATQAGLPRRFLAVSNRVASRRYGIDWGRLDYLSRTAHLRVPILLFHGDSDRIVPVSLSDTLAETLPRLVTYVRVPGAGHVRAWNSNPAAYESAVREFLARIAFPQAVTVPTRH